jgi:hypothetical protein
MVKMGFKNPIPAWYFVEKYCPKSPVKNGWMVREREYFKEIMNIQTSLEDGISFYHYSSFVNWHYGAESIMMKWAPIGHERRWYPDFVANALVKGNLQTDGENIAIYPSELPPDESGIDDIILRKRIYSFSDSQLFNYIKIHAEGFELETITENMSIFVKQRPIIAVTVYHNIDGLFAIEKMLIDNLKDYKFYFRQHAHMGLASIFYCIPEKG